MRWPPCSVSPQRLPRRLLGRKQVVNDEGHRKHDQDDCRGPRHQIEPASVYTLPHDAPIVYEPQIVLYDEPTTGLDPVVSDSIDKLILRVRDRGTSNNDLPDALSYSLPDPEDHGYSSNCHDRAPMGLARTPQGQVKIW